MTRAARRRRREVTWSGLLPVVLLGIVATAADAEVLPSASAADHAWVVLPLGSTDQPFTLRHLAPDSTGGPTIPSGLPFAGRPAALAASSNQVWIVFPATSFDGGLRRETYTVKVYRHPAFGTSYYDPPDRLGIVAALDGRGVLAGVTGTADGPVVLLLPDTTTENPTSDRLDEPRLLRLEGAEWRSLPLPRGLFVSRWTRLASGGEDGRLLTILTDDPAAPATAVAWHRDRSGVWERGRLPLPLRGVGDMTRVGAATLLAVHQIIAPRIDLSYMRRGTLLPLTTVEIGDGPWAVLGMRNDIIVVDASTKPPTMRHVDPLSGMITEPRTAGIISSAIGPTLHLLLVVTTAVAIFLILFLLRSGGPPVLDERDEPVPMAARLLAFAIDLAIGVGVSMIMLRAGPSDFAMLPLWTADLRETIPASLAFGVLLLHTGLAEAVFGRSIGKSFLRVRIIQRNGTQVTPGRIAVRTVVTALILLVPVLVVVGLMNPYGLGLNDQVARTVVVRRQRTPGHVK